MNQLVDIITGYAFLYFRKRRPTLTNSVAALRAEAAIFAAALYSSICSGLKTIICLPAMSGKCWFLRPFMSWIAYPHSAVSECALAPGGRDPWEKRPSVSKQRYLYHFWAFEAQTCSSWESRLSGKLLLEAL